MKYITAPSIKKVATNCNGPEELFWDQTLQVEESDVGTSVPHYLGYNQPAYKITRNDVGRFLTTRQQGSHYNCWWFQS